MNMHSQNKSGVRSAECGFEDESTMTTQEMKDRTKRFGLRVIRLVESLPKTGAARTIGGQLLRSGTSVGANYRAACEKGKR